MRVIKLTHGAGNGVDTACLMTASNMLIGKGEDGDNNSCVCPIIRVFIICTNDAMPLDLLGELYGPLAWEILGTRTDDVEAKLKRVYCFADWVVREIAPIVLRAIGLEDEARRLSLLSEITDKESSLDAEAAANAAYAAAKAAAKAAYNAAKAANAAYNATNAAYNATNAAYNATNAAYNAAKAANAAYNATNAAYAANANAAAAAAAAANAANAANLGIQIWQKCPEIIRKAAAIGDKRPQEIVLSESQLCDALGAEK